MRKYLTLFCQFVVGLTFLFSGLVKCIDPIGTSIKLHDYFAVLGLTWFNDWTLFFAWILCLSEFIIGLNIALGRVRHFFTGLALLAMLVFTPLTLYLAIENPVSDCGCFGDAVVLTNWQTFWKNVFLLVCTIILYVNRKHISNSERRDYLTIIFYVELVIAVVLCYMGTNHLPYLDFRPYRPGVNIQSAMNGSSSAEGSEYKCVYEKDGVTQEFDLEELPDEESGWTFVETKEYAQASDSETYDGPVITDFFLMNEYGEVITEEILSDPNYTFLLISPSLATADETYLDRIENLYEYCMVEGYNFYCATLNDSVEVSNWKYRTGAEYDFIYSDATILETIIRANPAIMLMKEGTILWKSCMQDLEVDELISAKLTEQSYGEINADDRKSKVFWLVFLMLLPIVLYLPIEKALLLYKKFKLKSTKNNQKQ